MVSGLVLALSVLSHYLLLAGAKPIGTSDDGELDLPRLVPLIVSGDDDGKEDVGDLDLDVDASFDDALDVSAVDESVSCALESWSGASNQPYGAYELQAECQRLNNSVAQLKKCPDGQYKSYALDAVKFEMRDLGCDVVFQWLHAQVPTVSPPRTTTTTAATVPVPPAREKAKAMGGGLAPVVQEDPSVKCVSKVNRVMNGEVDALYARISATMSSAEMTRDACTLLQRGVKLLSECPDGAWKQSLQAHGQRLEDDMGCPVRASAGNGAGQEDKNNRDDLDDEEVERQRTSMDKVFMEVYGVGDGGGGVAATPAMSDDNKSQMELPDEDERSEKAKTGKDTECVNEVDAHLFQVSSNGTTICKAIDHGLEKVGNCPNGSAKSDYTRALKLMQSQLCEDGEKVGGEQADRTGAVAKVPLKKVEMQPAKQAAAKTPLLVNTDVDEKVAKEEEQDASVCLAKLSDEFNAKMKSGDMCKVVKQALGELDRCADSKMKRESRDNLLAVQEFCATRL